MDNGVAFVTGRLTRDPQFFGEGEKRRVVFSVAFNRGKDERRKTTFIDCIAWGRRADILESFAKGSGVSLSGELETDSWEGKDGEKHSRIRLNVTTITATTSNRRNDNEDAGGDDVDSSPAPQKQAKVAQNRTSGKPVRNANASEDEANIPF